MLDELDSYDWREVFAASGDPEAEYNGASISVALDSFILPTEFSREDVEEIINIHEGCKDEDSWRIVVRLKDGRYAYLEGFCDYTGWDCCSGCSAVVSHSKQHLYQYGLTDEARAVFGITAGAF